MLLAMNCTSWYTDDVGNFDTSDWAEIRQTLYSNGELISSTHPFYGTSGRAAFVLYKDGSADFVSDITADMTNRIDFAVTMYDYCPLRNGEIQPAKTSGTAIEGRPRTGLGLSQDKRYVYLCVIEGEGGTTTSKGATYAFAAQVLKTAGAYDALLLDGGGSTSMVGWDAVNKRPSLLCSDRATVGSQRSDGSNVGVVLSSDRRWFAGDNDSNWKYAGDWQSSAGTTKIFEATNADFDGKVRIVAEFEYAYPNKDAKIAKFLDDATSASGAPVVGFTVGAKSGDVGEWRGLVGDGASASWTALTPVGDNAPATPIADTKYTLMMEIDTVFSRPKLRYYIGPVGSRIDDLLKDGLLQDENGASAFNGPEGVTNVEGVLSMCGLVSVFEGRKYANRGVVLIVRSPR